MYKIQLFGINPEDIEPILQLQAGQGGFQDLLSKINGQYSEQTQVLSLYQEDIERLYRYTEKYGSGGFQNRIKPLLEKINHIIKDLIQYQREFNDCE